MFLLGIETSCDDTSVAIVENGRNLIAMKTASQVLVHQKFGGVVPEIASRQHIEVVSLLFSEVLEEIEMSVSDLTAVAVTFAPGLIGSLLVGINFAKGISIASGLPIIPVHHIRGHIASLYLTHKDLTPPFLCLVVSGGHSHIIAVDSYTKMHIIGKTKDDAAGEAFDKAGRCLGFDYPGGVNLDKIAENGNPKSFKLPLPVINQKGSYDFSFSGLKTSVLNIVNNLKQRNEPLPIADVAASFRAAVVECLITNFLKAAEDFGYKKLAIAGGVSANSLLRRCLEEESKKRNFEFWKPQKNLCGDNGAMIASQGYYEFLENNIADLTLNGYACKEC